LQAGVSLPSTSEAELRKTVFRPQYADLNEYLAGFMYTTAVMKTAAACERVAFEFAEDEFSEGVRYFEVRFAPQLLSSLDPKDDFSIRDVLLAVDRGLRKARDEFNASLRQAQSATPPTRVGEPPYEYGIICSAMRLFFPGMSRFYDGLHAMHPDEPKEALSSMASVIMVQAAIKSRDLDGVPIVGVDIAGAELDNEAMVHTKAFALAHENFLCKTVHAGEAFGPESIAQAVQFLHAERIGHGFHLFSTEREHFSPAFNQQDDREEAAAAYVRQMVKWVGDKRITMEVCLTSNLNTMPGLKLEDHAFRRMLDAKVSATLATDNRLVSNTTTVNEFAMAVSTFDMTLEQLRDVVCAGFKRSFYPGDYNERRAYVKQAMD